MTPQTESPGRKDVEAILEIGAARRRFWSWRNGAWAAGAALVLIAVYLLFAGDGAGNGLRFVTEPATRGNLSVVVTATGTVQPTNKVDVSSELSGTVRRVLVDYNSIVKKGQILAELDTDKLNAAVENARAKLAVAKARLAEAEATVDEKFREYERKKTLTERQVSSVQDLDAARAAHERAVAGVASARAEIGVAEADLKLSETNLAKACICSPIDGVVLRRNVDPGQTVAASLQAPVLFSIAEDLKQMELQVDVDEADVGAVREGQAAVFSVDAFPERRFPARLRMLRYSSETIQGVVTYKAVLSIDNAELLLRPGMTATAEIKIKDVTGAVLVPNTALRFTPPAANAGADNRSFIRRLLPGRPPSRPAGPRDEAGPNRQVWILRDEAPVAIRVVTGATDGRRTEIVNGAIAPGQIVIVDAVAPRR